MSSAHTAGGGMSFRYLLRRGDFVLDAEGDTRLSGVTGIFGASGAGKTSLLRCIAGLERPHTAFFTVADDVWDDTSRGIRRAPHQREVAYVFQEPRLFPHLDVRSNLEYGRRRAQSAGVASFATVVDLLDLAGLLDRQPAGLSGGEAQRVAIGRALLRAPRLVLMDEPLTSLDRAMRGEVLPFFERLHAELDIPALYVSHDIEEICALCDRLLVLDNGRLLVAGTLQEVLQRTDLALLGGEEAGVVLQAMVTDEDPGHGLCAVRCAGGTLFVPLRSEPGRRLRVRIRASDVSLCRQLPRQTSILNHLPARIVSIQDDAAPSAALVHVEAGDERIIARITRRSVNELHLAPGDRVYAQIKSVSVRRPGGGHGEIGNRAGDEQRQ